MKRVIYAVVFFLLLSGTITAQTDSTFWNDAMAQIAKPTSMEGWVHLKENVDFDYSGFFNENKEAFGLGVNDELVLKKSKSGDLGYMHYKFQHTYKGVKVEGCEYILHEQNGRVESANGELVCGLSINVMPVIDENTTLNTALNNINATKYAWEEQNKEGNYISEYPTGELVLARMANNSNYTPSNFKLVYKFDIFAIEPYSRHYVYVDANTDEIFKKISRIKDYHCNCCNGTAQTLYNGQQTIVTRHRGFPIFNYILRDNCRGDGIETYLAGDNLTDGDNDWSAVSERPATSAHWAAEMTYDFYSTAYGRNSFDDEGAKIYVYTEDNSGGQDNAFWNGSDLHFGSGGGGNASDALVSLDVVGHEFTHGVNDYAANLAYEYESGALDESFADIFGAMVEFFVEGNNGDYFMSEDFWIPDGRLRDMSNPNIKGQPDTYEGVDWFDHIGCGPPTQQNDYCGVHTNSGVQNFWFFLLAEGGTGVNDNGDAYTVQGIGRDNAARIAYRNLTIYLTSGSDYSDAKNGSIYAAIDLFGDCSNEVIQTIEAWNAVGVSSVGGIYWNVDVGCPASGGYYVLNDMTVFGNSSPYDCLMSSGSYSWQAGNSIKVTSDGLALGKRIYVPEGTYFHARISPCLSNNRMMIDNNDGYENANYPKITDLKNNTISDYELNENIATTDNWISIYPNPTTNGVFKIYPAISSQGFARLEIFDLTGNKVYNESRLFDLINIDISHFPKGMYLLRVTFGSKVFSEKVIYQ